MATIQVNGLEEGDKLIEYLASQEIWVTPFVIEEGDYPNISYYVKADISLRQLEMVLIYVREEMII